MSYQLKDAEKFAHCTHLVSFGCAGCSSALYATPEYQRKFQPYETVDETSVVGISTNGNRPNRVKFPTEVLDILIETGCKIITDNAYHRNRSYNIGEREVAQYLLDHGYKPTDYPTHTVWQ